MARNTDVDIGQPVIAIAGRDTNHTYMVVGVDGPFFLLLSDGRKRKIANPKKKNIKHISVFGPVAGSVAKRITQKENFSDEDIRQALGK